MNHRVSRPIAAVLVLFNATLVALAGCSMQAPVESAPDAVLLARGRAVERWDAGRVDEPAVDAGLRDAGEHDAGPPDAGGVAEVEDSGVDDAALPASGPPTKLVFRVTTLMQNGRYQPKNVGAIWIEDANGRGIKTLKLWASLRIRYLPDYLTSNPMRDTVDVVTSPTLKTHQAHEVTWNLRGADNQIVPDGTYSVVVEVTDKDAKGESMTLMFRKGSDREVLTSPDTPYFAAIELRYE